MRLHPLSTHLSVSQFKSELAEGQCRDAGQILFCFFVLADNLPHIADDGR